MKKMIVLGMILMLGVLLCAGNIFAKEKNKKEARNEEKTKITSTNLKESEPSPNPFMKNFIILTSRSFQALRLCWKGQTYY